MSTKEDVWIHSVCNMCLGDCGILVHRVDGVVVKIEGDPNCPNTNGKICAKGFAGIMNLYDPKRVKTPLKRTNPQKGLDIDPGWVPISWEEALDILEEKLRAVKEEDPRGLAISAFDNVNMLHHILSPWARAYGTPNFHWSGYFCGQYLHSSMYLTNGTFHSDFDSEYCRYLILFGNQAGGMGGLSPNITAQKVAQARKRGLRLVVVDPLCTNIAAKADAWIPIKPGTDGYLTLAIINVLLNELGVYDKSFLKRHTNAPYLVKSDGFYVRQDEKPMVWDAKEGKAKPYDAHVEDYALEGTYNVEGVNCQPAFELLKMHVKDYTPELAAEVTTVPAATIRLIAEEFGRAASIGSTITVDGTELPLRPAVANIYRGAGAHQHGVMVALAIQTLNLVVGAFYVPGGHRGMNLIGPSWRWSPGRVDGLILTPPILGHSANYYKYDIKEPQTMGLNELFPISTNRSPMLLLSSLDAQKNKLPFKPKVLMVCRRNLFRGGVNYKLTAQALKNYEFIASFCIRLDEMAQFADIVLPEQTALEKLQIFPNNLVWSQSAQSGYWYWGIRQPVVEPFGESRDWGDVLMDLAERMGFIGEFYKHLNVELEINEPYKLNPDLKYTKEEIYDRWAKSEFGPEKNLEWFKQNGFLKKKRSVDELFPINKLNVRFPIYYENIKRAGQKVQEVTEKIGLKDWDTKDYEPLPAWKPEHTNEDSTEFDLLAFNFRVPTHSMSWTYHNPHLRELSKLNPYVERIIINAETSKKKGIKDRDKIRVESMVGQLIGEAKVTECIHPQTVGISSHFGHLSGKKEERHEVNFNSLIPFDKEHIDWISSGVDACVRVKVSRI